MREATGPGRYRWLGAALANGGMVLTSSRRLARELTRAFDEAQLRSGAKAWETPRIHAWRDWLGACYSESRGARSRIGRAASGLLWERCLRDQGLSVSGRLARQLMATWGRLTEWHVDLEHVTRAAAGVDERAFARAAGDYRRLLAENSWLDDAELPDAAADILDTAQLPRIVTLAGFDRHTPQLARFSRQLHDKGVPVEQVNAAAPDSPVELQSFANEESEFRAAGHWSRGILSASPAASIAIVSADLESKGYSYSRLIREGLAAGWQQAENGYDSAVQVTLGRRLADYPAISVALSCMQWASGSLTSREVSVLLRSSFIGGDETGPRSLLDLEFRRYPDRAWSPAACAEVLEDAATRVNAVKWQRAVREIAASQANAGRPAAPSRWVTFIGRLLDAVGWPAADGLRQDEYQVVARWWELLAEFGGLDVILPRVSFADAVQRVERLARETMFQPERGRGLVQLIDPLEASGMEFDHLWVAGVDAGRWPRPGNPLPLVSRALQREHGMPDSTPEEVAASSARILARLAGSARNVRFSWSRMDADTEQVVSPMIEDLSISEVSDGRDPGWYAGGFPGAAGVGKVVTDHVPAATDGERLGGGASVISLQRQNPFAAFARGRLGIRSVGRFRAGLPASLRGELLHDTLRRLYLELPSHAEIRGWTQDDRDRRVDGAVRAASAVAEPYADAVLMRLLAIERERLRDLASELITRDSERAPFRVMQVEERCEYQHAGLRLRLRADRIDSLEDGAVLIIDYKTGQRRRLLTRDKTPVDAQVFVYAAAVDTPVSALALINMNRPEIQVSSAGIDGEWGKSGAEEWERLTHRWRAEVLAAIEAIAGGDVRVNLMPVEGSDRQLDVLSRLEEVRRDG